MKEIGLSLLVCLQVWNFQFSFVAARYGKSCDGVHCPPGTQCIDGVCLPNASSNERQGKSLYSFDFGSQCVSNMDCPPETECVLKSWEDKAYCEYAGMDPGFSPSKCITNRDCPSVYTCRKGKCLDYEKIDSLLSDICYQDWDCPRGYQCDRKTHECYITYNFASECFNQWGCPFGLQCDKYSRRCVHTLLSLPEIYQEPPCQTPEDCEEWGICIHSYGKCYNQGYSLISNLIFGGHKSCHRVRCPPEKTCVNGRCVNT